MASLLDLAGYVQKQGELGRQRGEQSRLASLASKAYTAPQADRQSILGQMAQTSPDAAIAQQKQFRQGDSERMADLSRKAKIFVGMAESGNSQAVASLYPQIAQEARDLGLGDIPLEYNDTFLPGLKKFATILDGNGDNPYASLPSDIQSLKILQSDPTLAAIDRERRQAAGMVPKQVQTSQGIGWGTPGGGIELAPITGVAGGAGNGGFGIKETNDYVQSILGKVRGLDPSAPAEKQAEVLLPYLIQQESGGDPNAVSPKGAQGLTQVMPATGRDPGFGVSPLRDNSPQENVRFGRDYLTAMLRRYPGRPDLALAAYNAGPGVADRFANPQASAGPTIAQPYQKQSVPSGYRVNPDGSLSMIPGGPAQVAADARADAAAARKAAEDLKASAKAQEAQQRQSESATTAQNLVSAIDTLTRSPGFSSLGTAWGDTQIAIPVIRNDAKDADAQLKNIAGQVAMATLSRLKSLSATGATGFGALSNQELHLIQNSIATLQSERISNAELRRSLKIIRDGMEKVSNWQPKAESAPSAGGWKIERVN